MAAILFGSISTLADTSEMQREAFNEAFAAHDLDWSWDRDSYREMLRGNGGADRIREYAGQRGEDVDVDGIHATKSKIFQTRLAKEGVDPRPGVADLVLAAQDREVPLALVTTTSASNVDMILGAMGDAVTAAHFAVVLDGSQVTEGKPAPEVYEVALDRLGETAESSVAIEDNVGGVASAVAAGVPCIAFPNMNTADHDFEGATEVIDLLDAEALLTRVASLDV